MRIKLECGAFADVGSDVFNYYDQKRGVVKSIDSDGWARVIHDDGTAATLDGSRMCSVDFARGKGWTS